MIDNKAIKQIKSYFENKVIRIEASNTKRKIANYKRKLKSERVATSNKFDDVTNVDVVEQLTGYFTKAVENPRINNALLRVLQDVYTLNGNAQQRLTNFGKSIFVQAVENRVYGDNSEATIEEKGFNKKYYATGQLENSIVTYIKPKSR